jgi:hypothetical protein
VFAAGGMMVTAVVPVGGVIVFAPEANVFDSIPAGLLTLLAAARVFAAETSPVKLILILRWEVTAIS